MFSIMHWDGSGDASPSLASLEELFDELQVADQEHGDVAVIHEETGWSMSAHRDGRLVLENLDSGGERHMKPVPKDLVIQLWRLLAAGKIDKVLEQPWTPGYGP